MLRASSAGQGGAWGEEAMRRQLFIFELQGSLKGGNEFGTV